MNKDKAIELLERQIDFIPHIKELPRFSQDFKKWHRNTEIVIEKIFGSNTRHQNDFNNISFSLWAYSYSTPEHEWQQAFRKGLDNANSILTSMKEEIIEFYDLDDQGIDSVHLNPLIRIEEICNRFHLVANQIRSRHDNRPTLEIEDEYDVQDLIHALLKLEFDDVRPEEWTPSYVGKAARVDFLLKREEIIIEIKKTRKGLTAKEVGDQLLVDLQRYRQHPNCKYLVCFVYDPEGRIANPKGIENDLTKTEDGIKVITIITPKGL